jgi:nitroreductase
VNCAILGFLSISLFASSFLTASCLAVISNAVTGRKEAAAHFQAWMRAGFAVSFILLAERMGLGSKWMEAFHSKSTSDLRVCR